jgi:hypothetical protein
MPLYAEPDLLSYRQAGDGKVKLYAAPPNMCLKASYLILSPIPTFHPAVCTLLQRLFHPHCHFHSRGMLANNEVKSVTKQYLFSKQICLKRMSEPLLTPRSYEARRVAVIFKGVLRTLLGLMSLFY